MSLSIFHSFPGRPAVVKGQVGQAQDLHLLSIRRALYFLLFEVFFSYGREKFFCCGKPVIGVCPFKLAKAALFVYKGDFGIYPLAKENPVAVVFCRKQDKF